MLVPWLSERLGAKRIALLFRLFLGRAVGRRLRPPFLFSLRLWLRRCLLTDRPCSLSRPLSLGVTSSS